MKLAIFDFDGTLFPIDTLRFLLSHWKENKYSKLKYYRSYLLLIGLFMIYKLDIKSRIPRETIKNKSLQSFNYIFSGMSEDEVIEFLNNCAEGIIELLNPAVVEEVRKAKNEGYHIVLLSGAYELLLHKVADYLEIDTVIGTKMHFIDGVFDYNTKLEIITGSAKLKQLNKNFKDFSIDLESSLAFADSISDIEILKSVGHPVVVNPDDKLKEIAIESGWRIIT
ncbi:MAG: HAD family hydrolase [Vulcanibacillus sp.]